MLPLQRTAWAPPPVLSPSYPSFFLFKDSPFSAQGPLSPGSLSMVWGLTAPHILEFSFAEQPPGEVGTELSLAAVSPCPPEGPPLWDGGWWYWKGFGELPQSLKVVGGECEDMGVPRASCRDRSNLLPPPWEGLWL